MKPAERNPRLASNRSPNWAFVEKFEVPSYDDPTRNYLTRWRIVQTPWFGVYLHRFDGPDPRPTLHDHPWAFVSLVLRGGYDEVTPERRRSVTRVNAKAATDLHYIARLRRVPTWTLMLVGRRKRVWGYRDGNGWTRFDEHPHNDEFAAAMRTRNLVKEARRT